MFDTYTTHSTWQSYYSSGYFAAHRDLASDRLQGTDYTETTATCASMIAVAAVDLDHAAWWAGYMAKLNRVGAE